MLNYKTLEQNIGEYIHSLCVGKHFLGTTQETLTLRQNKKLDFKTKNLHK